MKTHDLSSVRKTLSLAEDYSEFLKKYLEAHHLSCAAFSRRAGFASRSFPRDVIKKKRRLSPKSLPKFLKALKIPASGKILFELLVAEKESDVRESLQLNNAQLQRRLTQARFRFANDPARTRTTKDFKNEISPDLQRILSMPGISPVFAALGSKEEGSSPAEIGQRLSGISSSKLKENLARLESLDLCELKEGKYYPKELHTLITGAGKSLFFKKMFDEASLRALKRSNEALDSPDELFFVSSFLVPEERLPELKQKLRAVLLSFVDENIDSKGRVVELLSSLHYFSS